MACCACIHTSRVVILRLLNAIISVRCPAEYKTAMS